MKYKVEGTSVSVLDDETLVAGSVGVHYAEFEFDESWDEYAKTAVFRNGNVTVEMLVADGRCEIPWEVLAESGQLYVGIRGELGEKQRPTLWASRKTVYEGAEHGDEPREATQDMYQQLLSEIADISEGRTPEMKSVDKTVYWKYTDENESKWRELVTVVDGKDGAQGPKGDKGDKGDTGARGEQGPQGQQGPKGDTGATGATGSRGEQGAPGKDGKDGKDGAPGEPGKTPVKGEDYYTEADKAEMVAAVLAALPNGDEVSY
jgi:hypothetical protein